MSCASSSERRLWMCKPHQGATANSGYTYFFIASFIYVPFHDGRKYTNNRRDRVVRLFFAYDVPSHSSAANAIVHSSSPPPRYCAPLYYGTVRLITDESNFDSHPMRYLGVTMYKLRALRNVWDKWHDGDAHDC